MKYDDKDINDLIKNNTLIKSPLVLEQDAEKISSDIAKAYKNKDLTLLQNTYPYMNEIMD